MSTPIFKQVDSVLDFQAIAQCAREVWSHHYGPIIGQAQVDYMLEQFQSPIAIQQQIENGTKYFVATKNTEMLGYLAIEPNKPPGRTFLSKIYTSAAARGTGVGLGLLQIAEEQACIAGSHAIWLTVNKENTKAHAWYERQGFQFCGPIQQDIGNGFVMDDFRYERPVPFH